VGKGRYVAVDVHYPAAGGAVAAAVVTADLGFGRIVAERVAALERVEPYRPGAFWERELPAIRAVLSGIDPIDLLVVDGYVQLDPAGRPGLGARVAAELAVPVIGVAKTAFRGAGHAIQVVRGQATRPLYVTAAGIPPHEAAALVQAMAGRYRLPDALRRVDALSRGATGV
jgi:deoxyribonuclease V